MSINVYGQVSCCSPVNEFVGNIRDGSLLDLWHSKKMRMLRQVPAYDCNFKRYCGYVNNTTTEVGGYLPEKNSGKKDENSNNYLVIYSVNNVSEMVERRDDTTEMCGCNWHYGSCCSPQSCCHYYGGGCSSNGEITDFVSEDSVFLSKGEAKNLLRRIGVLSETMPESDYTTRIKVKYQKQKI